MQQSDTCAHSFVCTDTLKHICVSAFLVPGPGKGGQGPSGPLLTSLSSLATSLSSRKMPSSCPMTIFMRCRIRSRSPPLLRSSLGCPRSGAPRMFILYHVATGLPILPPARHTLCLSPRSPPRPGRAPHLNGPPSPPWPWVALTQPLPPATPLPVPLGGEWDTQRETESYRGGQGEDTGGQGEGP